MIEPLVAVVSLFGLIGSVVGQDRNSRETPSEPTEMVPLEGLDVRWLATNAASVRFLFCKSF